MFQDGTISVGQEKSNDHTFQNPVVSSKKIQHIDSMVKKHKLSDYSRLFII